jgi:hypothetical protein
MFNFDNMPNALVSLFVMATTAGWSDVVVQTIGAAEEFDHQGDEGYRPVPWTLFFMLFMIMAHFFFFNLFIVVVISTFKAESNRVSGTDLLTMKQKEWIDLRLLVLRSEAIKRAIEPEQRWRKWFFNLQNHRHFEKTIQICIILNTIILMIKWYRQHEIVN